MSDTEQKSTAPSTEPRPLPEMPIHFIKGSNFRVVHADGVWFGGNLHGDFLHLTFYSERAPIPQKIVVTIDQNGNATEVESKRESKQGIVREMEVDIVLSLQAAVFLQNSLTKNLTMIQEMMKSQTKP